MDIHVKDTINFPIEDVFTTYRDKLPELARYLPNVDKIEILEREDEEGGDVRLLNLWKAAATEVPSMLRPFIKPEMLQWKDFALWHSDSTTCDWRLELEFFKEQVKVGGTNRFEALGDDKTRIILSGELTVDAKKIPGVPRLLAGKIGPTVEKFVVNMITPNLTEVNRGVEKYLEAHRG